MTTRFAGGFIAASFAVGILTGAAGTIVVRDATRPTADVSAAMAVHMGGAFPASMMSGPMDGSFMPGSFHDQHHPAASQEGAR